MRLSELSRFQGDAYSRGFFLSAYALWFVASFLEATLLASMVVGAPFAVARIMSYGLLILSELTARRQTRVQTLLMLALIPLGIQCLHSGISLLFDELMFIYFAKNLPFRSIAKASLALTGTLLLLVVAASQVGLIPDFMSQGSVDSRHYLGFRQALRAPQFFFVIVCLYVYLRGTRFCLLELVALSLINAWFFCMAESSLAVVLTEAALIGAFFVRRRRSSRCPLWRVMPWAFVLAGVVSVAVTLCYDPSSSFFALLNEATEGRVALGNSVFQEYGLSLLGQPLVLNGSSLDPSGQIVPTAVYRYVDCMYVKVLIQMGFLFTLVYFGALGELMRRLERRGRKTLVLIFVLIALHCLLDDLMLYLLYNPFILLLSELIPSESTSSVPEADNVRSNAKVARWKNATLSA